MTLKMRLLFILSLSLLNASFAFLQNGKIQIRRQHAGGPMHSSNVDENEAAKRLLEKAQELRAEIAAMEGKSIEQVEEEAEKKKESERLRRQEQDEKNRKKRKERELAGSSHDKGQYLVQVPETFDDMVRQAARAVERAFQDGKTRQTVRFNLVREEGESATEENEWPGGARQMYREAGKPLTTALLREARAPTKKYENPEQGRLAPTLKAADIWDFDGSALHTAEASEGASGDIQALVFPNTDVKYIQDIQKISDAMGPRLFLLINPFWRDVESWGFNLLAPGAKAKAQKTIFDNGYDETYVNLVFTARGEKCVAIKAYPYDWQLFAFREDDYYPNSEYAIRLGSCKEVSSSLVTELLNARPEFKETKTMRQMKKMF